MDIKKIELLAPAGSLETFFAALEAGADAVYCGLHEFSARAKARNFSLEEMERLTACAHREGRRLYVTLNTLIKEDELPRMVEILAALAAFRVDGLIIQDLGLWRLVRDHFPELPLHASTQMTIHNAAGVRMLERLGFSRAVLARELSLDEIAAIRKQTKIELEHFIHGALCFSISGQCLFSSYLGGKSGNRGRCAQPCRRRYSHQNKPGFYFSTSDLCAIELAPRLAEAGVMSFKIEGRMKNAEYVATVVAAYRKVLDAGVADKRGAILEAHALLAASFGRQMTAGFLRGNVPADLTIPSEKGGIGRQLGKVEKIQAGSVFFSTGDVLHVGDRLRLQPQSDLSGTSFTIKELFIERESVKRAEAGSFVNIPTPFRGIFQPGDLVYKVSTGKAFTLSEEACRRRLADVAPAPAAVRLALSVQENFLILRAEAAGSTCTRQYEVEMLPAEHSPLSREILRRTFAKTGHDSLSLEAFKAGRLPRVVIQPSRLKEIRREFYHDLAQIVTAGQQQQRQQRLTGILATLLPAGQALPVANPAMTLTAGHSRDLAILDDPGVGKLLLPLTPEHVEAAAKQEKKLKRHQGRIVWDIPAIIFEEEWKSFRTVIRQMLSRGFSSFRLNNLSHFHFFDDPAGVSLSAGPWLYVLNSNAALALKELGTRAFTLSLEDDKKNMTALLCRELDLPAAVTVYSPVALVTSRIPMRSLHSGNILETDGGEQISLDFATGLSIAHAGRDFSLLGHLLELQAMGCAEFIVDLSVPGILSNRGRAVLAAAREDRPLADTSLFNFERGLE